MTTPEASVIVPVYNRAGQIRDCLESLVKQTGIDFEIIVVDDGSTDRTKDRVRDFIREHPQHKLDTIHHDVNRGINWARNSGVKIARGEFVAFIDSDAVAGKEWLEELVSVIQKTKTAGAGGRVIECAPVNYWERSIAGIRSVGRRYRQSRKIVGCNMAFRRNILDRFPFDNFIRLGADEDELVWRLKQAGMSVAFASKACVYHCHRVKFRSFTRIAYEYASGTAIYWRRRGIWFGRDVAALALSVLAVLVSTAWPIMLWIAAGCLLLQYSAVLFNEHYYKGKSWGESLIVSPASFFFQVVKFLSVVRSHLYSLLKFRTRPSTLIQDIAPKGSKKSSIQ